MAPAEMQLPEIEAAITPRETAATSYRPLEAGPRNDRRQPHHPSAKSYRGLIIGESKTASGYHCR